MRGISPKWGNVEGDSLEVAGPTLDLTIDHNTCINSGTNGVSHSAFIGDQPPSTNIRI